MHNAQLNSRQILIAAAVAIACFLPPFIGSATGLIASEIFGALGFATAFGSGMFPWLFTIYTLASTIFLIPAARLADKYNKKTFFCAGVLLLGLGSLGVGLSDSIMMILIMRGIQGIGNALMFGTAIALIASSVPQNIRGTAIGIAMTGVFCGQLAAPLLAGALTNAVGWYAVFIMLLPISLAALILGLIYIPKDEPVDTGRFDWAGSLIFIAGMSFAVYGFSKLPDLTAVLSMIAGLVMLAGFFVYEKKNENPIIPINVITDNRGFAFNSGANLLYYVAIYSMDTLISTYMTEIWGISDPFLRALIITTEGLILVLFTIIAGRFYDQLLSGRVVKAGAFFALLGLAGVYLMGAAQADAVWLSCAVISAAVAAFGIGTVILGALNKCIKNAPTKYATSLGLIIIIIGMFLFLTSGETMSLWLLIAVEAIFGIGIAIFVTPNSAAIMNSVTEKEYSMASGTLSTVRMLGMALSFGIVAILETSFITGAPELYAGEFLTMLHGTILASVIVLVAAVILSWFGINKPKECGK